jgi:TonB-linked SusC/RagA family outer membrane protein
MLMKGQVLLISTIFFISILFISFSGYSQQRMLNGKVTNSAGEALIGVNIQETGTKSIALTNSEGIFSINIVDNNSFIEVSAIGYVSAILKVGAVTNINVELQTSVANLDEVFVVAYGKAKRGSYTGAATIINQNAIKDVPATSFENALSGKVAGLQVTQSSGQAGAVSNIRIRGIGSMNASNEPLYVIDGVPVTSGSAGQMGDYLSTSNNLISSLNPDDIESITVLKDAAASSLYGSRAANGVVVITTKKGKLGKPVINLKSSVGITPDWATNNYETADVQSQVNMLYQVFYDYNVSNGKTEQYANSNAISRLNTKFNKHGYKFETAGTGRYENVKILGMTDGLENREGKYYDWNKALFRTGVYNTNDLSVSGATDKTSYYSSVSYTMDKSRISVNDFQRFAGRLNVNQKVGKYVELMSNVSVSKDNKTGFNDSRSTGNNYFFQSRNLLWPLYWPTDYKTGLPYTLRYGSYAYNAKYYNNEWENSAAILNLNVIEGLTVKITDDLNVKSIFSYNNSQVKEHLYYSAKHFNGQTTNGYVNEMTTNINKILSSTTINYNKDFGQNTIGFLGGYEIEKNLTDYMMSSGTNLPSSALHTVATAGETSASAYNWGYNMMSVLSKLDYNYAQKYYLSASFRRDGSSRYGINSRWGNFWSVAGSWRINNESFLKNIAAISDLRLRASYGTNGTLPVNNYGWRSLTGYSNKYMGQAGGAISTVADPNLTWETSYSTNIALEFGLLQQRVYGTIEYFNRNSKNLLQDVPISMVTGFTSTLKNVGEINNHGIEVTLGGDIIRRQAFRWTASINGTFLKSSVTKLYKTKDAENGQDIIWNDPTGGDARAQFIYSEGASTLAFYGFEWAGVDQQNGKNVWYVNDPSNVKNGDFIFNGKGATYSYSKANRKILGSGIPKLYGGVNTEIEFKNISLSFNFIYKLGGKLYDGAFKDVGDDGYYWERIRSQYYYENMWTNNNKSGSLPLLSGNDLTDAIQYSSRQMHDASFLRLKNVTVGYRFPHSVLNKAGIKNTRIYFDAMNVLTFSKYKIADPEVNQYSTRGWETPFGKTFTFGLELSF